MPSKNRPFVGRGRATYEDTQPMKDEEVYDLDRKEYGTCVRRLNNGGGSIYVRFGPEGSPWILYTHRKALGVWKAFPGPADAQGLRSTE